MEETQSELTKISTLPKRQRLQVDESIQITSHTLDKSLTEISDVTDLSISRIQKSFYQKNINNDSILSENEPNNEVLNEDKKIENDKVSIIYQSKMDSNDVPKTAKTNTDENYVEINMKSLMYQKVGESEDDDKTEKTSQEDKDGETERISVIFKRTTESAEEERNSQIAAEDKNIERERISIVFHRNSDSVAEERQVKPKNEDVNLESDMRTISINKNTESQDEDKTTNLDIVFVQNKFIGTSRDDTDYVSKTETNEIIAFIKENAKEEFTNPSEIDVATDRYSLIVVDEVETVVTNVTDADEMSNVSLFMSLLPKEIGGQQDSVLMSQKSDAIIDDLSDSKIARRIMLIQKIKAALIEKDELTEENETLESKVAELLRRKRPDAATRFKQKLQDQDTSIVDKEAKYGRFLFSILQLQKTLEAALSQRNLTCLEKQQQIDELEKIISDSFEEFSKFRNDVGIKAMHSNTGRRIPIQDLETMFVSEKHKNVAVETVRLENIKLFNTVMRLKSNLYAQESLSKQLNLVDFEQLKIENQAFNGKLEEKSDLIIRLSQKISNNAHMISHMKEKVKNILKESQNESINQKTITGTLNLARKSLTRLKSSRDEVLAQNKKLVKSGGLLGNNALLDHFKRTADGMEIQKSRYAKMTCNYSSILKQDRALYKKPKYVNDSLQ